MNENDLNIRKNNEKKEKIIHDFIYEIKLHINFWNDVKDRNCKEKLEGLAHSILCILDGVSGTGDCNISKLNQASKSYMLHDQLYKKDI